MPKVKSAYVCRECGAQTPRWNGKCQSCGAWNSLEEIEIVPQTKANISSTRSGVDLAEKIIPLSEANSKCDETRYITGISELDRVLGGGLVKGSIVLLGGEPGIGKSTLLLQICEYLGQSKEILYVSGEESVRQIKLRADRLGVKSENLYLLAESDAGSICETVSANKPDIVIIDSIQTMSVKEINSTPGSITQVRECTGLFMRTAKNEEIPFFIVGHVNKDGAIAGPKVMEHIVDAVLYFEGERNLSYRILRAAKNRFGSTNEIGVFEMKEEGLLEVKNASEFMLSGKPEGASGSVVSCSMEGTRPILLEIQALVCHSNFGIPRRQAIGMDFNRLNLLMAVLEKRLNLQMSDCDAYVNLAGGMRIVEPAIDLGVAMAVASSFKNRVIDDKTIVFGEIGLSGEVRGVSMAENRVAEAAKLGFTTCILPAVNAGQIKGKQGMHVIGVKTVRDAIDLI